ncbi:peptide MFS transporter [Hyalangium sp.]|uniref:peptide MFS transporter n=1 Tax=Hyalangium sp. TaxID=2028555 RepID=UPI002D5B43B1|nr:peptide MFS transporter [Hyalangium sp.]HYH94827.1 peptide MFS transporter [Hyalangium sp.]
MERLLNQDAGLAADLAQGIATQQCSVESTASVLYALYTSLVYLTPVLGGWVADRYLGQKKSVYVGAILMALGQFVLFGADSLFFIALLLLIIGSGLFKPALPTQVGSLYAPEDARRDGAFAIFYMGVYLGTFLCTFVCGLLAAHYGWRYGFLAAGVGMCIGLLVQFLGRNHLAPDALQERKAGGTQVVEKQPLTPGEWKRVWALGVLCLLNVAFWAVYEQRNTTLQMWVEERSESAGGASWEGLFSVSPIFFFALVPLLDRFWAWQNQRGRAPFSVAKMAMGCFILLLSILLMVLGTSLLGEGAGGLLWALVCTVLMTIGEIYVFSGSLSLVTRVAPVRIVSLMVGVWFLSTFVGTLLAGLGIQVYWRMSPESFFPLLLGLGIAVGVGIWLFNKPLRKGVMPPDHPPRVASAEGSTAS